RYEDPACGRFVSEDSDAEGVNWYAYAGSNPTSWCDHNGKDRVLPWDNNFWFCLGMAAAFTALFMGAAAATPLGRKAAMGVADIAVACFIVAAVGLDIKVERVLA